MMRAQAKRITFRLRESTIQAIDSLVQRGVGSSRNKVIEVLVGHALRNERRREWEAAAEQIYAAAFQQPEYGAEQGEIAEIFSAADAETADRLDP